MNMQDKEFDALFRSKLGGMEAEPSARVWKNISAELGQKQKRSVVPVLRIAASVVMVLTAGVWFTVKQTAVKDNGKPKQVVRIKTVDKQPVTAAQNDRTPQAVLGTDGSQSTVAVNQTGPVKQIASVQRPVKPIRKAEPDGKLQASDKPVIIEQPNQAIAATTVQKPSVVHTLPDVTLTPHQITVEPSAYRSGNETPATVVAAQPEEKKSKKRGIRSLGDLVNVVIAKIDKRETKLIEFSDTDDDQTTVTGLNLGVVRITKEK